MLNLRLLQLRFLAWIDAVVAALRQIARNVQSVFSKYDLSHKSIPFDTRIRLHHSVIQGKDGFLFHRDNDAIEQLTGRLTYSRNQLNYWRSILRARKSWCDSNSIVSRFLIVPEKHVVYENLLPETIRLKQNRAAAKILVASKPELNGHILYPVQILQKARAQRETFFLTDTHWTDFGAFVTYTDLVASLVRDIALEKVEEDDLLWIEKPRIGDLGVRFDPERSEIALVSQFVKPISYRLLFQNTNFGRGAIHIYGNERKDLPHCVLFRDSFANFLIPYLMNSFSRIVAVSSLSCHFDLLEVERPDVTIFATAERFLASYGTGNSIELPQDRCGPTFEQYCNTSLKLVAETH